MGSPSAHGDDISGAKIVMELKIKGESDAWIFQWAYDAYSSDSRMSFTTSVNGDVLPVVEVGESIAIWVRKIQYSCSKGVAVNQLSGTFIERLEGISKLKSQEPPSAKKAAKRGSVFNMKK